MSDQNITFVFPGQGSQFVGMGQGLAQAYPPAMDIFRQADDLLGYSLSQIAWEGPEQSLNDTINTQPALFTHSIAVLQTIQSLNLDLLPSFVAGHSMGELSALVAAGALSFSDGLRLVRIRGELMKLAGEKSPGGMAAVMGLDISQIEQLCTQASSASEIVRVANDNCPGQVVISGSNAALDRVQPLLEQVGAKRVIRLAVSIAAHSPFMSASQADFNQAVASAPLKAPYIPVIGNVTARPLSSAEDIREDLQNQLTHRVRWTESIQFLVSQGVSEFIEIGSGAVLSSLIKRIDRNVLVTSLGTPDDFQHLKKQ
ncbi:MAG: [acyl-carrier-protein] S-malonyltransferase [Chloroflexi bacterium RBG_16_47_49]|nr:MAG: [acyl-carrier-protein] S-malonyltransferase [Chloroflexi bacterium RBG_16_47_49]